VSEVDDEETKRRKRELAYREELAEQALMRE